MVSGITVFVTPLSVFKRLMFCSNDFLDRETMVRGGLAEALGVTRMLHMEL